MPARAMWIIGTPFSGSTMVQLLLSRFEKVFTAGELDRIRAFNMHPHFADDPRFYQDACAYCQAHGGTCPVWTPGLFEALGGIGPSPNIYGHLAAVSGKDVIVDSSKTPWWYLNVTEHRDFATWEGRVFVLHCVRNPFAYAQSVARRRGISLEESVMDWVIVNRDAIAVIERARGFIPILTVYHNKVLKDPDGFLAAVGAWCDVGPLAADVPLSHFLGGNIAAYPFKVPEEQSFPETEATIRYFQGVDAVADDDGRWRAMIDVGRRWRLASLPGVRETCGHLGIDVDGLIGQ